MASLLMDDGVAFELDASGRIVADAQPVLAARPAGPWDMNGQPEPVIKTVCVFCEVPHTMQEGIEPASHGACALGVARFEAGLVTVKRGA